MMRNAFLHAQTKLNLVELRPSPLDASLQRMQNKNQPESDVARQRHRALLLRCQSPPRCD